MHRFADCLIKFTAPVVIWLIAMKKKDICKVNSAYLLKTTTTTKTAITLLGNIILTIEGYVRTYVLLWPVKTGNQKGKS